MNIGMSAGESENSGTSSNYGSSIGPSGGQGGRHSRNRGSGTTRGSGTNWGENRGQSSGENISRGYSETIEYAIEPGDFARILKTGGKPNGNQVTGIWFQGGRTFKASGNNFMLEVFQQ